MSNKQKQTSDNLNKLLGRETWMRGVWLGAALIGLFVAGAGVAYLLTLLTGWELQARVIVSLLLGPVFGTVIFAVYWLIQRPSITTFPDPDEE